VVSTGIGWPARGWFANDDYGFSVRVPTGVIAWSGVAKAAPFHGFGFSLDKTRQSCINLHLEWRVDRERVTGTRCAAASCRVRCGSYCGSGRPNGGWTSDHRVMDGATVACCIS